MAKKKSFFGTLLKLGGLAAATAAVYYKRNEIRAFLAEAAERMNVLAGRRINFGDGF